MKEVISSVELKLLNELIRPALSPSYKGDYLGIPAKTEDLRFDILMQRVKEFYLENANRKSDWRRLVRENW